MNFFDAAIAQATQITFSGVPHEPATYLNNHSKLKVFKKWFGKWFQLKLHGQLRLEQQSIPLTAKCLWLYTGKRNFGDANMDLSGRALLKNKATHIDLLTLPHLQELFEEDDIFQNIYSHIDEVQHQHYDFIILSEFNYPSIRLKIKHFKSIPFVCLFRFFLGPDRNQILFSHFAMNHAFALNIDHDLIQKSAKPYITHHPQREEAIQGLLPKEPFIALGLGGIDPDRSYNQWLDFLQLLDQSSHPRLPKTIVLLGSDNGLKASKCLLEHSFQQLKCIAQVGTLSLLESRAVICAADIFIGCDGGLMHLAHSTDTPSLTLFAKEPTYLRLTQACKSTPIQGGYNVNVINPQLILEKLETCL